MQIKPAPKPTRHKPQRDQQRQNADLCTPWFEEVADDDFSRRGLKKLMDCIQWLLHQAIDKMSQLSRTGFDQKNKTFSREGTKPRREEFNCLVFFATLHPRVKHLRHGFSAINSPQ